MLREYDKVIKGLHQTTIETIRPFCQQPSNRNTAFEFVIHQNHEEARAQVQHLLALIFTDGSVRQDLTGIAVAWKRPFERPFVLQHNKNKCNRLPGQWNVLWETAGRQDDSNEYVAELQAIQKALRILSWQPKESLPKEATICTDCQAAIQSIQNPHQQSGQFFLRSILQIVGQLQDRGLKLPL